MELKLNVVPLTSFKKCKLNYGYMLTKHMICGGSEGQGMVIFLSQTIYKKWLLFCKNTRHIK